MRSSRALCACGRLSVGAIGEGGGSSGTHRVPAVAKAGEPLTILVWNVQYGASRKHHFFYDGGEAVRVPEADVQWTLDAIAEVVAEVDPDVILWQELDRGSDRTHRVDMVQELLRRAPYPCTATTPYHRVAYVPHPGHEHLGKVDMHLGVFSRVRLTEATRHQLPLLDEPVWRAIFNLRRAALEVRVPVAGGPDLTLLDTHLSAFSRGDGTLPRQVRHLRRLALQARDAGDGVVLAGDMNSLPPGDDPGRLSERDQLLYSDSDNPVKVLYDALTPALAPNTYAADPGRAFTYIGFGQDRPDRMIDHAFTAGPVRADSYGVRQDRLDISDHLPLVLVVRPGTRP